MLHGKKEFSHYASFAIAEVELAWKKGVQGAAASEQHRGWPYGTCMQPTGKDNFLHRVITLLLQTFALLWKCLEHALPVQHSQPGEIPDFSDLKAILNFQCIYSFQATQIPTAASDNEIDTVIMSLQSGRLRQSKSRSLD